MSLEEFNTYFTGWIKKATEFKFPPGVLGKTARITALAIIAAAILCPFIDRSQIIWVICGIFGLAFTQIISSFVYGHLHPNHALLEGAHLVRAIEAEMSARDQTIIDRREAPPLSPPPPAITADGGADG